MNLFELESISKREAEAIEKKISEEYIPIRWITSHYMAKISNDSRPAIYKLIRTWEDTREESADD